MNDAELLAGALDTLQSFAPEVAGDALKLDQPLRAQVDLDSMDWLNFLIGLHQRFGVDIPETDYARLTHLAAIADCLAQRQRPTPPEA